MKSKNLITLMLSLSVLFTAGCIVPTAPTSMVYAASETVTENGMSFTVRRKKKNELMLTAYSGNAKDLTVPEKVGGKTVTAIDNKVFSGVSGLENVTLPDTISYFGADVFRGSSVKSVNIPKSLKVIPSYTFDNCKELKAFEFHDGIAIIANTAFKNTDVTVPDTLKSRVTDSPLSSSESGCSFSTDEWDYDVDCLDGRIYLEFAKYNDAGGDMVFPDDLSYYDEISCTHTVFDHVSDIRKVVFPEKMSSITVRFANTDIEEAVLPQDMDMVDSMFENCSKLRSVTFSGNTTSLTIGAKAFKNCTSLKNISIPEKCKKLTIGSSAFENTGISELELNCPSDIGSGAFAKCSSLLTAELTDANISERAFMNCTSLTDMTFKGNIDLSELSVYGCDSLENVNFNDSRVTSCNAFRDCPMLYTVNSEKVFDSSSGDFVPTYRAFIVSHFGGSDNVGFINDYVSAQVKRVVRENTDEGMTDIEKVIALHDWVCDNTKYTEGSVADRVNHSDVSLFLNEYTVCEGYARACNLLYHEAGLESYYVNSSDHAWNIVNVGGNYFHVDATLDDLDGTSRKWFMKSDGELRKEGGSHAEWALSVPSPLHEFQGKMLPECEYRMGDINADGAINTADLVTLQKYLHGRSGITKANGVLVDICCDGKVDVLDMVRLRRIVIGELSYTRHYSKISINACINSK